MQSQSSKYFDVIFNKLHDFLALKLSMTVSYFQIVTYRASLGNFITDAKIISGRLPVIR